MTPKQEKDLHNKRMKLKMRKANASGRFFLDQSDLGEARWNEAIQHSVANREGVVIAGVNHKAWGCGCCFDAFPVKYSDAKLSKQPKSQRKPAPNSDRTCVHFRGKVK